MLNNDIDNENDNKEIILYVNNNDTPKLEPVKNNVIIDILPRITSASADLVNINTQGSQTDEEFTSDLYINRADQLLNLIRENKKKITNKEFVQLSDHERKLISNYFGIVIQIFNTIKPQNVFNSPYHPFFIYKIIEQLLKGDENIARKTEILSCIHLQSRETLIRGDLIWKQICSNIKEFIYLPTDPS